MLHRRHGFSDAVSIHAEMGKSWDPAEAQSILDSHAAARTLEAACAQLAEYAERRSIQREAFRCLCAVGHEEDLDSIRKAATAVSDAVSSRTHRTRSFHDVLCEVSERGGEVSKLPTGFRRLDGFLSGGLAPGTLTCLCARPKVGKSAIGMMMAMEMCSLGKAVKWIAQEMTAEEMAKRVLQCTQLESAKNMRFEVHDKPVSAEQIRAMCYRWSSMNELDALFVDYLQILVFSNRRHEHQELASAVRTFKQIAQQFSIPVVLMVQALIKGERRKDNRIFQNDVKGSGAPIEDSDATILMWPDANIPALLQLDLCTNRHGETGRMALDVNWSRMEAKPANLPGGLPWEK